MKLKNAEILKKNWLPVSKLTWGIWWILTWALESLKNLHFNGLLLTKVYNVWVKKHREVMFNDSGDRCKIWRITDFWFAKWNEKFGKFSPEHSKVSKLENVRKCMNLEFTEEFCIMAIKNDAKFEEELTCRFKIDMRNLTDFLTCALTNLRNLHFNGLIFTKIHNAWARKLQRNYVGWHWRLVQNL